MYDAILDLWKRDDLENAEASLSASINQSQNPNHHLLSRRALVSTHMLTLTLPYTKALEIEPSLIAYIEEPSPCRRRRKGQGI